MKILFATLAIVIVAGIQEWFALRDHPQITAVNTDIYINVVKKDIDNLNAALDNFLDNCENKNNAIVHYHETRKIYKHLEFFIEHVSSQEAKNNFNGPLVSRKGENQVYLSPTGFQQIESVLFEEEPYDPEIVRSELKQMAETLRYLSGYYQKVSIRPELYLEMLQLQLIRITTRNLNGYDETIELNNVEEASWNLEAMIPVLNSFKKQAMQTAESKESWRKTTKSIQQAIHFLNQNNDYVTFDRLTFMLQHVKPIYQNIITLHQTLGLPWSSYKQAINLSNPNLFSKNSYNLNFFSIYYNDTLNNAIQAKLGKMLFFDPILSGNNKRSCASCHQPNRAFSDGLPTSLAYDGNSFIQRNAPSLTDVALQKIFFMDGRASNLEQQAMDVVHSQVEMNSSLAEAAIKLRESKTYRELFDQAFKLEKDRKISVYAIQKALTEYEKTLTTLNSKFDRYLAGDKHALTTEEKLGFNLFAGKALCASCHFFPLFNGTVPPFYTDSEFEILGTPENKTNKKLDPDQGRFLVTGTPFQRYAFKTPTLRNIALTAPYMHNGIYPDLKSVMDFYRKGGGKGFNYEVPNQTLPFDTLVISPAEQNAIIRFMETLTDTTGLIPQQFTLPLFENKPEWNNRKWGGEY